MVNIVLRQRSAPLANIGNLWRAPPSIDRGTATGRTLVDGKITHIPDVLIDTEYTYTAAHLYVAQRSSQIQRLKRAAKPEAQGPGAILPPSDGEADR
jgi:hypothetical protein